MNTEDQEEKYIEGKIYKEEGNEESNNNGNNLNMDDLDNMQIIDKNLSSIQGQNNECSEKDATIEEIYKKEDTPKEANNLQDQEEFKQENKINSPEIN